ncbi:hypothetical protein E8E11_005898 [Didymella keratinophila]|nr:hypothetical protein E8E11_005898 [Didymella keratinophila]
MDRPPPPPWLLQRPQAWQTWPGAHFPEGAHPLGTTYSGYNRVPQYPGGTTCEMLGERDPYFPMDGRSGGALFGLIFIAFLVYIAWPIYVLRHLVRKSVYGDDQRFQANHEAYRAKMGAAAKGRSDMEDD